MLKVMPKPEREDTAEDCLRKALEKAPTMNRVLVLYEPKDKEVLNFSDNGLTIAQTLYMIETFKHWMMNRSMGEK